MEATGSLWHAVAQAGDAYGYPVDGLNPQRVHTESQTRGRAAQTDTLYAALIAECAWLLRQAGQLARWEPRAAARQPLLRLRTHAKEPLVWQQAVVRALREQGVVAVALTLAEQTAQQLAAWVKQMEQQIAPWEATRPEWQAVLRCLRTVSGIGRWGGVGAAGGGGRLAVAAEWEGVCAALRVSVGGAAVGAAFGYGVCRDGNRWLRWALVVYALQRDGVAYDMSRGSRDLTLQHRVLLRSELHSLSFRASEETLSTSCSSECTYYAMRLQRAR